ncbi:MAG: LicD family protein [Proteiniphilum sp.]
MCIYKIHLPHTLETTAAPITDIRDMTVHEIRHLYPNSIQNELSVDDSNYKRTYGFDLSRGEIANFLSHREVWKQFLETGMPWCLVIESNVHLALSADRIDRTIEELPDDWDIFFPFDLEEQSRQEKRRRDGRRLLNINYWETGSREPYLLGYKLGNSIYMTSRKGAINLLSLETIEDRLDHTIMNLSDEGLNVYNSNVDWFDISLVEDYNWPDRCRLVYDMAIGQSSWNESRLEKARKLLKTLSDIARENSIGLMLEAGTLLGYIRHGGIMMWDDDIDIAIEEKDIELFFAQLGKHDYLRHDDKYRFRGTRYFKVWDIDGERIEGYDYTYPFIDIWVYKYIGNNLVFENGITYPDTAIAGMKDVLFEGAWYKVPENSQEALDSRFSDWRRMIRVYTWCHQKERNSFKYLYIPIKTSLDGRMTDFG